MDERTMLLDLKWHMERQLRNLERQLILIDPRGDDKEYDFLNKKAIYYRDKLKELEERLSEL